jgi:Cu(I)/Ag(I) efflux system membrane fusion protein
MKTKAFLILVLGLLATFAACTSKQNKGAAQTADSVLTATGEYYTCPMHTFIRSDRPGACPICGMTLVKKSSGEVLTANQLSLLKDVSLSPSQMVLANVNTASVKRRTLNRQFTSVGVVSSAEPMQATIAARFSGRVEKLYANYTGETVRKGQPLFELYSPDLISATQDYILALDGLRNATAAAQTQNEASQDQLVGASRKRLMNHFGMTEDQIRELEKTRRIPTAVRFDSPIRGTVLTKDLQEGQYVNEGMVLYQLVDLSKVWIYLDVYEQNMRFLEVGQQVTIRTDAYPGEEFHGHVTFIDPTMNGETRTLRVRTETDNPDLKLKPNMYVETSIQAPVRDALVVPTSAIMQTGKRAVVWVESRPNTFEPRNVVIGSSTDEDSEILGGLNEGDTVAVSGGFLIDSESQLDQSSGGVTTSKESARSLAPASGADVKAEPSKYLRGMDQSGKAVDVNILVHGNYEPDVIHGKVGVKLRLHFYRDEDSDCTAEVVFKEFNIKRFLPPRDTILIEITPVKVGTIDFECGEGMVHGKIIVSK